MKTRILISLFIISFLQSESQTIIPDMSLVSGNWTLSNSPYVIQGRAIVPTGQTLTIDPGVQVKFASDIHIYNSAIWSPDTNTVGSLRVNGKIIANGNATDTIAFIANGNGYWGSLFLTANASGSSSFSYCKFQRMFQISGYNISLSINETYSGLDLLPNVNFNLSHLLFENNQYTITVPGYSSVLKISIGFSVFKNNVDSIITTSFFMPMTFSIFERAYIYNCIFDNSSITGSDLTVVNCILKNSDSVSIFPFSPVASYLKIINSLSYNNHRAFVGANYVSIYNSTFLNNFSYDTACGACPNWILNNNVFDGVIKGTWTTTTINYPSINPNLVNPVPINGDFHLTLASICINAGDTTGISTLIPAVDLDGNPRYIGTIDIGPYEFIDNNSINQIASNESINIYPNPATNKIHVNNSDLAFVYDVFGNKVKAGKNEIDVSDLSDGIYFVSVKTTEGIFTKKIIIQH